jgi:carboxyl-terminal processing protease
MLKKISWLIFLFSFIFLAFSFIKNEWIEKDIREFSDYYRILNEHYVDSINSSKLIKSVITHTNKQLDPFTAYYDSLETKARENAWAGVQYSGIGVSIQQFDSLIYISDLVENNAAHKAGIKIGDALYMINDTLVTGKSIAEIRPMLIGETGTSVKIEVLRTNKKLSFTIVRNKIVSPAVSFADIDSNGVAYIKLNHFLRNSVLNFSEHFDSLKKQKNIKALIIDLRGNTGGLVDEANNLLNLFLPANTELFYLRGKHKDANYSHYTPKTAGDTLLPLLLMIDNKTISAAEIVAGSLQDLDRASIVGERTYGKGFVQGTRFLPSGSSLYVTAARYYTPSGRCLQEINYASDIINANKNDTSTIFYTKQGKAVKAGGGVHPDTIIKSAATSEILAKLVYRKESFYFLNSLYIAYTQQKDKEKFINKAVNEFLTLYKNSIDSIKLQHDFEIERFEKLMYPLHKKHLQEIKQEWKKEKQKMLDKAKNEVADFILSQMLKRDNLFAAEKRLSLYKDAVYLKSKQYF